MKKQLSSDQVLELEAKVQELESFLEESVEMYKTSDQDQISNGDFKYLVESHCIQEDAPLSEEIQEALKKSSLSKTQLIERLIEGGNFEMEYEELSSPFQYGGANTNEFHTVQWGGDREIQIDKSSADDILPSFKLNNYFDSKQEFEEYVRTNISYVEGLSIMWELSSGSDTSSYIYNTDYDIVRCILDEESALELLEANKKPEVKKKKKTLKLTEDEYSELRDSNSGFCVACGKINDGGHEPDAEDYECSFCEEPKSSGIELLLLSGVVEIVEDPDDSTLLDATY